MDTIFWNNSSSGYGVKAPVTVRDHHLKEMVEQPSWIIEGVYFKWLAPSFAVADMIFILHTPLWIQEEQIWNRYENRKAGFLRSDKEETVESVEKLIVWNRKYNQDFLQDFIRNNEYKEKIVQLENSMDIFAHLGCC